jgi:hypothetical protein
MPQIGGTCVEHVEKHHATLDHLPSFNALRSMIQRALDEHRRISDGIEDAEAKADFDQVFAENVARAENALTLIEAAIKRIEGRS